MSIIYKSCEYKKSVFSPGPHILPYGYSAFFGWITLIGKKYVVDNTWEEERFDGDGYVTINHGTREGYYKEHYIFFDEIKNSELIFKLIDELYTTRTSLNNTIPYPVRPSQENIRLAKIKGEPDPMVAYLKEKNAIDAKNFENSVQISKVYNEKFREIVSLVYPTLNELPDYPLYSNSDKERKIFDKAAKKAKKQIDEINGIRAARAFKNYDNAYIISLPKDVKDYLEACYSKYKKSNFVDEVWN